MPRIIPFLFALSLLISCEPTQKTSPPRIAIAGLAIESSTFSPARTQIDAFHARRGEAVFTFYPFLETDAPLRKKAVWFPTLRGHALPGGRVTLEAYETLVEETLSRLKENLPYDGLFFDIHGAMSVEGLADPEGDFIKRIRALVGYETLISTSMDLHGNVSKRLAEESDLITCYRMAPHEDALESKERAVKNLVNRLSNGKGKPSHKAYVRVPILLPGEKTSTRIDPGKSLYARVEPLTQHPGIIDAAIWIGYAWADEPRNHAVVMVTGDDKQALEKAAQTLANAFWEKRFDFDFVAPTTTFDEALKRAFNSSKKPFVISDMGDNPTAGGAGDVTWTLAELLKTKSLKNPQGPQVIYASIPGPKLIAEALKAGVGQTVEGLVGAAVDNRYAPPILLKGTVKAIHKGDKNAEVEVVIQTGSLHVIVTQKRKPYHYLKDFTTLNLNPKEADILIVKIGYLVPELYDLRGDWVMALTPGGVDQDLERLPYKNLLRPIFPLDKDMADPHLGVDWIPRSGSSMKE